jgi:hypothetical protein
MMFWLADDEVTRTLSLATTRRCLPRARSRRGDTKVDDEI